MPVEFLKNFPKTPLAHWAEEGENPLVLGCQTGHYLHAEEITSLSIETQRTYTLYWQKLKNTEDMYQGFH